MFPMLRELDRNTSSELFVSQQEKEKSLKRLADIAECISKIENNINTLNIVNPVNHRIDFELMPFMVEQTNRKYPELNLTFLSDTMKFSDVILSLLRNGTESARFIINLSSNEECFCIHFAAFDYKMIEGKASLIMLEPYSANSINAALLMMRVKSVLDRCGANNYCEFFFLEVNVQKSRSDCGLFSLVMAKKAYKESSSLEKLHQDNLNGVFKEKGYLEHQQVDKYLPPSFYKHAQSLLRIQDYLDANPDNKALKVNKKGETLIERYKRYTCEINDKQYSTSILNKRLSEYRELEAAGSK